MTKDERTGIKEEEIRQRKKLILIFFNFSFLRLVPLKIIDLKGVDVHLRATVCVNIAYFGFIALVLDYLGNVYELCCIFFAYPRLP